MASWNDNYEQGFLPWDTGVVDPMLAEIVGSGVVPVGRAIDVGCGTGTNAIWLAQHGYDVLGVDVAPLAIEKARAKLPAGLPCRFATLDFLVAPPEGGPFQLVFDRGCFHVFDEDSDRARFAARVAERLAPGGLWLSLIGSTEGPARELGPPRRSARDIVAAIEPVLAIEELAAVTFAAGGPFPEPLASWRCVARRRSIPAQPSTRRS
jgi:methyl halide transferase